MQATQNKYLLKVVSGPHQGAELDLPLGDFLIGSADECDVILSDSQVAPRHARVSLSANEMSIEPLGSSIFLDGKLIREKRTRIEPFHFVTVGTTYLVFGPADSPWPAISSKLPSLETATPSESPAPQQTPAAPAKAGEKTPVKPVSESTSPAPATAVTPAAAAAPAKSAAPAALPAPATAGPVRVAISRPGLTAMALGMVLLIVAAGVVTVIISPHLLTPSASKSVSEAVLIQEVSTKIDDLKFSNVECEAGQNNRINVTGYVDTLAQRRQLRGAINSIAGITLEKVSVRVYSLDGIIADCREIAAAMELPLTFTQTSPGVIQVRGYVPQQSIWSDALRHFQQDVPGVKRVEGKVMTADQALSIVGNALNKENLQNTITVQAQGTQLVATGLLAQEQSDDWERASAEIRKGLDNIVQLEDRTRLAPAQTAKEMVDAEISGIIVSDLSWISLKNGMNYFTGGVLPNGYVIKEIKSNAVYLQRNEDSLVLKAGDSIWSRIK